MMAAEYITSEEKPPERHAWIHAEELADRFLPHHKCIPLAVG